ncbi:uncharacterized protein [Mycetomoellerius zeteki]|uniref:uncharacterized protein n=1 Tax=Mycetomoellerius zeteki TaxID=64791 RepID=UPI00084EC064|nr:PREDICTED: uncharacterized protein LOC108726291 [Trachymyrmex zeteki]
MVVSLCSDFIGIVLSANESRSHHLQVSTEYFIYQQRYFYLMFFHVNATITIGCTVLCGTGSLLIAYLQHACGMFKIASYRIKKAIRIYTSKNVNSQKEILVYKGLIHAVDIHRKSMTFSNYFMSRFQITFLTLVPFGVLTTSLNIYRVCLVFCKSVLMICILFHYVALD